jgi:CARDB.
VGYNLSRYCRFKCRCFNNLLVSYYADALDANNYTYIVWDTKKNSISSDDLIPFNVVIWFTGDDWRTTLTSSEQSVLQNYLDNGGNLFISGQDIGYDIGYTEFYSNYLHAEYISDDTNIYDIEGITGDHISDGLSFKIKGGSGASNQMYQSAIEPADNYALPIFRYMGDGYGAIKAQTQSHKVVYFAFGFEAVDDTAKRNLIMDRTINWLSRREGHDIAVTLKNQGFAKPEENVSINITIYNLGNYFENVNIEFLANNVSAGVYNVGVGSSGQYQLDLTWSNAIEGVYNLTAVAVPVSGERYTKNNIYHSKVILTSKKPIKAVVLDSWGTDYASSASWDYLNQYWVEFGNNPIEIDYHTLDKWDITYQDIVDSNADVLIISLFHTTQTHWMPTTIHILCGIQKRIVYRAMI